MRNQGASTSSLRVSDQSCNNTSWRSMVDQELTQKWWAELRLLSMKWENDSTQNIQNTLVKNSTSKTGESTSDGWLQGSKLWTCQEWSSNNWRWLWKPQLDKVQRVRKYSGMDSNHSSCNPWTTQLVDVMKSIWELSKPLSHSLLISETDSLTEISKIQNSEKIWLSIFVNNKLNGTLHKPWRMNCWITSEEPILGTKLEVDFMKDTSSTSSTRWTWSQREDHFQTWRESWESWWKTKNYSKRPSQELSKKLGLSGKKHQLMLMFKLWLTVLDHHSWRMGQVPLDHAS